MGRELGQAVVIQIHGQKGHIAGHIAVAEALIELNAVVDNILSPPADVGRNRDRRDNRGFGLG